MRPPMEARSASFSSSAASKAEFSFSRSTCSTSGCRTGSTAAVFTALAATLAFGALGAAADMTGFTATEDAACCIGRPCADAAPLPVGTRDAVARDRSRRIAPTRRSRRLFRAKVRDSTSSVSRSSCARFGRPATARPSTAVGVRKETLASLDADAAARDIRDLWCGCTTRLAAAFVGEACRKSSRPASTKSSHVACFTADGFSIKVCVGGRRAHEMMAATGQLDG
mmetsp:Transcript_810/g.1944  ORF Transcript_810/g.1944 Transcript_810/m.1944 type:complete len:226 (-) Transcript_810:1577-2254(-)